MQDLLSFVREIKAGTDPVEEKAELVAALLLSFPTDHLRASAREHGEVDLSELSPESGIYMAKARHVADSLVAASLSGRRGLDWSPVVLGLCKVVELEFVRRIIDPLKVALADHDLSADCRDRDVAPVANYLRRGTAPDLGAIRQFLITAAKRTSMAETSPLIRALRKFAATVKDGPWLQHSDGAQSALKDLMQRFVNPSCHGGVISEGDYIRCSLLVCGAHHGILARLMGCQDFSDWLQPQCLALESVAHFCGKIARGSAHFNVNGYYRYKHAEPGLWWFLCNETRDPRLPEHVANLSSDEQLRLYKNIQQLAKASRQAQHVLARHLQKSHLNSNPSVEGRDYSSAEAPPPKSSRP